MAGIGFGVNVMAHITLLEFIDSSPNMTPNAPDLVFASG